MSFWGVLGLLQKAYSLGFTARKPPRGKVAPSRRFLTFAQIKPAKINLSLFGRLSLPKVEDERRAVLLFGFDQDVVDVGLDGAHGKE